MFNHWGHQAQEALGRNPKQHISQCFEQSKMLLPMRRCSLGSLGSLLLGVTFFGNFRSFSVTSCLRSAFRCERSTCANPLHVSNSIFKTLDESHLPTQPNPDPPICAACTDELGELCLDGVWTFPKDFHQIVVDQGPGNREKSFIFFQKTTDSQLGDVISTWDTLNVFVFWRGQNG